MEKAAKTILIIDDEKDLSDAIATALSYEGFTTFTAEDGEAGLALALEKKPDLIFLDIVMPKLDGLGVLKQLREDPWGKNVDVIVMTVLDDMEKIAEVVEKGGNEYLVKTNITLGAIVEKAKERLGEGKVS